MNMYMQDCMISTKEIYGVLSEILYSKVYKAMHIPGSNKSIKDYKHTSMCYSS